MILTLLARALGDAELKLQKAFSQNPQLTEQDRKAWRRDTYLFILRECLELGDW